jgi:ectoine hydroxylase
VGRDGPAVPVGGLTEDERATFDTAGYLLIRGALDRDRLSHYQALHERLYAEERTAGRLVPPAPTAGDGDMHSFGFVLRDPTYLELLDLPSTFRVVWGILGWNIHLYHCHIDRHGPVRVAPPPRWRWHQDGGRQNVEIESEPRPRLSVKVAHWLSDVSEAGRGNLLVVPGSHLRNRLPWPGGARTGDQGRNRAGELPAGATPILAEPGDALVFDRRLWHARSDNTSRFPRRALFLGYTYRWIRPRDDLRIDWAAEPYHSLSPVRRQLLGWGADAMSFWGLGDDHAPLRGELLARGLLDADRSNQR